MSGAQEVTARLGGTWYGHYGLTFCPAHENRRTPALSLRDGEDGRLLAYCHAGCDYRAVLAALRQAGHLAGHGPAPARPGLARLAPPSARDRAAAALRARRAHEL